MIKKDIESQRETLEEKYRDQIGKFKGTIAGHEGEISQLKAEKATSEKKAIETGKQISGFENEIMRMKWEVQTSKEKMKSLGGEDGKDRTIAELKATLEGRAKEIRALREAAGTIRPASTAPSPKLEEMVSVFDSEKDKEPGNESKSESPPEEEPPPPMNPRRQPSYQIR